MAETRKPKKLTSLYDSFMAMLRPFYSEAIAGKLAEGHCEAHKQFLRELYLQDTKRGKVKKLRDGKPIGRVKRKRPRIVQAANQAFGRSRAFRSRSPVASMEDVKREVLSFLGSTENPAPMADIFASCKTFGWSMAQIKRAVRELRESHMVMQEGIKKFTRYQLAVKPADPAAAAPDPGTTVETGDFNRLG